MANFLEIALSCIRRGWYTFPCVPKDKVPVKGCSGYLDATLDEAQVREWWAHTPNANVPIATGKSGLVVLDVDTGLESEEDLRAFMSAHDLPETFAVRTGSRPKFAVQLYYSGDGVETFNHWEVGSHGGDVRGSTWGHVMAAGCIHPDSGEEYKVLWDVPIVPVPNFVRALKAKKKEREIDPTAPIVEWRNDTLYRVLCKHRANGADDEMLRDYALRAVAKMPDPLDEAELEQVITNACKQPIGVPDPVAVIPGAKAQEPEPDEYEAVEDTARPVYPDDVWEGTPYGDFADYCTEGNFIRKRFFTEALRTVVGAVVGSRLSTDCQGVNARAFTLLMGPPGSGKGTAVTAARRFVEGDFDSQRRTSERPLLWEDNHDPQNWCWPSRHIGAHIISPASAPGLIEATKPHKLEKGEPRNPMEVVAGAA